MTNDTIQTLIDELIVETDRIWLEEPEEIRAMRLGVFPSGAGSNGQYFSNLVFINGDMRALSTWITPSVVLNSLADDTFTLKQAIKVFTWTNRVFVDFLAYVGFTKFASYANRIIEVADQCDDKMDFHRLLEAWYSYANRMYLWVHQVFPWSIGDSFKKLSSDDVDDIAKYSAQTLEADYFAERKRAAIAEQS